jgi:putative SOS response-associated peptidase YedK
MRNLYSMTSNQRAILGLTRATRDTTGNLPPLPSIVPDTMAPVVRQVEDGERELTRMRWGMPGLAQSGGAPVQGGTSRPSAPRWPTSKPATPPCSVARNYRRMDGAKDERPCRSQSWPPCPGPKRARRPERAIPAMSASEPHLSTGRVAFRHPI